VYALHWGGADGVFRQSFFNRLHEASFAPFSAPLAEGGLRRRDRRGVRFGRPLSVISGGGERSRNRFEA